MRKLVLFLILLSTFSLYSQSLYIDTEFIASGNNVPLWLQSNHWGDVNSDEHIQNITSINLKHTIPIFEVFDLTVMGDIGFRLDQSPDFLVKEVGLSLRYGFFLIRGGYFREPLGDAPFTNLSSGALAISGNARPIPKITFMSDGYFPVPGFKELVWVKGGLSHGQFFDDRYVDNILYHEKYAYAKLERGPIFSLYGGLVHLAFWGGDDPSGAAISPTWENFFRVFFNTAGGDDSSWSDQNNRAGDSRGIWDMGMRLGFEEFDLHFYKHHFFEDGSGFYKMQNALDGLWGAALENKKKGFFKAIVLEFLNTKYQSGPFHDVIVNGESVIINGRDSYYSHGEYRSGWTHYGRIIGTPFFMVSGSGDDTRISSNRVWAFSLATELNPISEWIVTVRADYVRHYHPYTSGEADFVVESDEDPLNNLHTLITAWKESIFYKEGLDFEVKGAMDLSLTSDISFNYGLSMRLRYSY